MNLDTNELRRQWDIDRRPYVVAQVHQLLDEIDRLRESEASWQRVAQQLADEKQALQAELAAFKEDAARLAYDLEDTKGYVGDYFWEKWDFAATLAAHYALTGGTP